MTELKMPKIESKYLAQFQKLAALPVRPYTLTGTRLLLEPFELGETETASGIVLASNPNQARGAYQSQRAYVGIVLLTGEDARLPAPDGTPDDKRISIEPGNIVLLSEFGVRTYSTFPGLLHYTEGEILLSATDQIHLVYPTVEAFYAAVQALNG